jgi:hypothetical protein
MLGEVGHGDILLVIDADVLRSNYIAGDITMGKSADGDYVSTMATTIPRFLVHLPKDVQEAVEEYRWSRRLESRSAAIRALVELGLKAAASHPPKPAKVTPRKPT